MANHSATKKSIRQIKHRTKVNKDRISRIRTFVKKVESALLKSDKKGAAEAFKQAQPELAKGAQHGLLHKNTVARKLSRLSAKIKALG